jgi:DNA-binding NarL/FixJ family response regulator
MITVFIVDDYIICREGIKRLLSLTEDVRVAGEAGDANEALRAIRQTPCDVVLVDLALPGIQGLDVLRELKTKKPNLRVLVLSLCPEEHYAVRALKEGASGYLTKESLPSDLIQAIRQVARGGRYISASVGELLADKVTKASRMLPHDRLSDREYDVFRMLAEGKSVKQIAHELCLAQTTISTHRARILEKMQMKTTGELIRYAAVNLLMA